jgi:predicted transcriptional regulator
VKFDSEKVANDFLELASEQRLNILVNLSEKKLNISKLADLLNTTKPEVHRNVNRLAKSGLIEKDSEGNFGLTTYGSVVLVQIPSLSFISENRQYFSTHTLGGLEPKFIQRLGSLHDKKQINGFVKVLEKWNKIHENAEKYICNILSEVPYSRDIIDVITTKLENKVKIRSVFSEKAIIPEERKKSFEERGFQKYIVSGLLERRIKKDTSVGVLVTEKEAAVFFPNMSGDTDLSAMFFSSDPSFRDWCFDYFEWCWKNSTSFQESKLKG